MIPSDSVAIETLIERYLPESATSVGVSDAGIISDLTEICSQLNIDPVSVGLQDYIDALNERLENNSDLVAFVSNGLDSILTVDASTAVANQENIKIWFDTYQTFSLKDIQRLGLSNENKLIQLYNLAGISEWYPASVREQYFLSFNNVDYASYSIGQTALHQYDNYDVDNDQNYKYGHILDWNGRADLKTAWENTRNLMGYSRTGYAADAANGNGDWNQKFGYGVTVVGQNGFEGSKSIDTTVYRDKLTDEYYRISLTAEGAEADSYDNLPSVNATGADSLIFYADFSLMRDIGNIWAAIRDAQGDISANSGITSVQFLNLDVAAPQWETVYTSDLDGRRGFVSMSLSEFTELDGNSVDLSSIKQVKIFLTGDDVPNNAAGSTFTIDMVGFLSDNNLGNDFVKIDDMYEASKIQAPGYEENYSDNFTAALNALFANTITDLNGGEITLFDRNAAVGDPAVSAYDQLIAAYNTMTLKEKDQADADLTTVSGNKYTEVDQLKLFVTNYDTWNNTQGMLARNADEADTNRKTVVDAFAAGTDIAITTPIDNILGVYDSYPDYYKYAVQTYWPDRNLHAVYPNFNPKDVIPTGGVTMQYSEADGAYTGTFNLDYIGMVGAGTVDGTAMNFKVDNLTLKNANGNSITINVSAIKTDDPVVNGDVSNNQITLSIPANQVPAGNYSGNLVISFDVLPDSNNDDEASNPYPVADPDQYRQTITIPVKLTSVATYTVTIPANIAVPWGGGSVNVPGYAVTECFMPEGSSLTLGISSKDEYAMVNSGKKIAYNLEGGEEKTGIKAPSEGDYPLTVTVAEDQWTQGGLAQGTYQDTLTFTAEVVQTGDVA